MAITGGTTPSMPASASASIGRRRTRAGWHARLATRPAQLAMIVLFLALHAALFLLLFPNTREDEVVKGFLWQMFDESGRVLSGAVPYRDFLFEYPPGSLVFMLVPRVFASGFLAYRALYFVQGALLDLAIVVALAATARGAGLSVARALVLYTLFLGAIGPLAAYRLDLAPAALTALAVLAWQRNRPTLAAAALAAGTATKVYPLLLLPPLIMDQWLQGRARRAPQAALGFAVTLALFLSPALLAGSSGIAYALRFQIDRHLQVESIWATLALLLHVTMGWALQIASRSRALVILGPGDALGQLGTPALIVAILAIYWVWWRLRHQPGQRHQALLIGTAALILAPAILTKVLSPQYLLWVMPSFALLPLRRAPASNARTATDRPRLSVPGLVALVTFGVALPLTQWIYPMHYGELVQLLLPMPVGVLAARNLLLVLALAALLIALWQARPVGSRQ